jgi:hypothetical protein
VIRHAAGRPGASDRAAGLKNRRFIIAPFP